MQPSVDKLVKDLEKQGIEFTPIDGHLENVIFTKGEYVHKIAWQCFYRFSGMSAYYQEYKGNKKNQILVKVVEITDDFFINNFMKELILYHFKNEG